MGSFKDRLILSPKSFASGLWLPGLSCDSPRDSPNFLRSSFCSSLSLTGVSTFTATMRSPLPPEVVGMPPPRMRKRLPVWVSPDMVMLFSPSSVGTVTLPPRAAVTKLMGTSQ